MERRTFSVFLVLSLLANAFSVPHNHRLRRQISNDSAESTTSNILTSTSNSLSDAKVNTELAPSVPLDPTDDEDDDFSPAPAPSSSGGGSNIFSILNLLGAVLPGSSSASIALRNILKNMIKRLAPHVVVRVRRDAKDIETNYIENLKQSLEKQEEEKNSIESFEADDEEPNSNQELDSSTESEEDYDEPPEGDGQGGLLGLLAGLSGGEDGQSDLGSLLATVSGIVANLSGDGIDLNSLIASGIGLFVGLLSDENQNPGDVIASYFLTSLDTITGGGAQNNGAFFGNFLSKLILGTSAGGDPDASSEENSPPQKDSAGFIASLLMALLGNMSKGSSSGSSHPMRRHFDTSPIRYMIQ